MIKAIIFDADDTLYATSAAAKTAELLSMEFFGKQKNIPSEKLYSDFLEIVKNISKSKKPLRRHRLYSYGMLAKKHKLKEVGKAYKLFFDEVLRHIQLMPHVEYALKKLSKYKLAIVTQDFRSQMARKLAQYGLKKYFKIIVTCDDARVMKPNKKYFQIAFKKLKIKADEAVVVGDDYDRDLRIPKALGCKTVIYGFDKDADYSFLSYKKLPEIIKEIDKEKLNK